MKALLALVPLLCLLLAGCGAPPPSQGTEPPKDAAGRYVIELRDSNMFQPVNAQVPVNSTVAWVNKGGLHDVSSENGAFDSDTTLGCKMGAAGCASEFVHQFTQRGTFAYHCEVHIGTGMRATINVV